jgi:Helix-turn-helix domain
MRDIPRPEPDYLRIADACARYGLSRAGVYRLAGAGHIRLVKLSSSTLVDGDSLRAYMRSLPDAQIRPPRSSAAASDQNTISL